MARKREKLRPIGVCDLCGEPIAEPYTARGLVRLECSVTCRQTMNSRHGAQVRSDKAIARFARGEQTPPMLLESPEGRQTHARKAAAARAETLRAEVEAGTWRNPALSDDARARLSRPRVHGDNPDLHAAFEKRKAGVSMADLSEAERAAYLAYEQARRDRDRAAYNAKRREQYARRHARKRGDG